MFFPIVQWRVPFYPPWKICLSSLKRQTSYLSEYSRQLSCAGRCAWTYQRAKSFIWVEFNIAFCNEQFLVPFSFLLYVLFVGHAVLVLFIVLVLPVGDKIHGNENTTVLLTCYKQLETKNECSHGRKSWKPFFYFLATFPFIGIVENLKSGRCLIKNPCVCKYH